MNPEEQHNPIWEHHMNNLKNGTSVKNEDGSISTVRTTIMGDGDYEYLIPTVWDGQILSDEDAWSRAMESGIDWPKAPAGEVGVRSLEQLDSVLHEGMSSTNYIADQMRGLQGFAEGGVVEGKEMNPEDQTEEAFSENYDFAPEGDTKGMDYIKNGTSVKNEGGSIPEDDQPGEFAITRIEDISPQNLPLIAGPDDIPVSFDELGGTVYRSSTGRTYTLYPEIRTKQERPIVTAVKAAGEYLSDPYLPSLEETSEFAKEAAVGAYEPFRKIAHGDNPTYGDLNDAVGSLAGSSAATAGKTLLKNDPTQLNIFAGLGAREADWDAFKEARKLKSDDVSPQKIEAQTGWHEGKDGFWRFEIDDSKVKIDRAAISERKKPSEILSHPQLFQNYDLDADLKVSFDTNLQGAYGQFDPNTNTITLDPKLSDKQLKKTLLHEVQHYVQFKESFTGGSNPEWESLYGSDPKVAQLRDKLSTPSTPKEANKVAKDLYKAAYAAYRKNYGEVEANVVGERATPGFLKRAKEKVLGKEPAVTALEREGKRYAEGGVVEDKEMNRLFQEGGIADDGMSREPVTGNEIPPGSMASEVRDDIPTQLSEGEYVVPADVLRYYGVRFFEDLRAQAKQGMMEMEADGRIGGVPVNAQGAPSGGQEDALTPEEEQMLMEALGSDTGGMAMGGYVDQQPLSTPYQDQATMYQAPVTAGMAKGGTTFDRTQFSSGTAGAGIEAKKYINPKTGETRTFNFIGTTALGIIPEDFVPWTQSLADQATENTKDTSITEQVTGSDQKGGEGKDRERGLTGTDESGLSKSQQEAMAADPFSFGMDALGGIKSNGMLDKLSMAPGLVGIAASLANKAVDANAISKAEEAYAAMDDNDPNKTALGDAITAAGGTPPSGGSKTATPAPTGPATPAGAPTAPSTGGDRVTGGAGTPAVNGNTANDRLGGGSAPSTGGSSGYGAGSSTYGGGGRDAGGASSGPSSSGAPSGSTSGTGGGGADSGGKSAGVSAGYGGYGGAAEPGKVGPQARGGLIPRVKKTTTRKTKGLAGK